MLPFNFLTVKLLCFKCTTSRMYFLC